MKKRIISLLLTGVMCLCLMPAALAAAWYETGEVYEVYPFYVQYVGSSKPATGIKEMTIEGQTVKVSVYPAGTLFHSFPPLHLSNVQAYVDGKMVISSDYGNPETEGLPAQGVYEIQVYSDIDGYAGDAWVTAENSGSIQPPPQPEKMKKAYQGDGYYITVTKYGNQNLDLAINQPFSDGLICYYDRNAQSYGFADKNGNVVVSAQALVDRGYQQTSPGVFFSDGLLAVGARAESGRDNDHPGYYYGYINRDVELVIPTIYRHAEPFVDGVAVVQWGYKLTSGYIDTTGKTVLDNPGGERYARYQPSVMSEGLFFQTQNLGYDDTYGIFDESGRRLALIHLEDLGMSGGASPYSGFSEGYLVLNGGGGATVIDREGELVWRGKGFVPAGDGRGNSVLYKSGVHSGLLIVENSYQEEAVVNVETGEFMFTTEDNIFVKDDFRDGLVTAYTRGLGVGVLDDKGNFVIPRGDLGEDSYIGPFNEGLAIAVIDDEYYLLEKHQGTWSSQPEQPTEPEQPERIFSDVDPNAWYASFVETVYEKGLFAGAGNGTFAPEANMTYAEFLTVLSQFSGETLTPVTGGAWYDTYVSWAREKELIPAGMAENFNPTAPITRQDMAALFGTFLGRYDHSAETVNPGQASYKDAGSIADYAGSGVQLCYQLGIMSGGSDGTFAPQATATRAQVAVTMVQMARVMGK